MKGKTNAHKSIRTSSVEFVTVNVIVPEGLTGYEVTISVNANAVVGSKNQYRRVEYIESTGEQYVDTGFIPNQDTRVVCDFALTDGVNKVLFGARASSSSKGIGFWKRSAGYFCYQYNGTIINSSIANDVNRHTVDANKNIVYIDGESAITHSAGSFTSPATMLLFAVNENGTVANKAKAKLYSCQIYDNGTLIRDYVPVIDEHGVAGLYDSINDTFSPSATTTNFIAGESVKEVIAKQTTPSETYKIPHGVEVLVKPGQVIGHKTPKEQLFITSLSSRTISVIYDDSAFGVLIYGNDGKLYTESSWNQGSNATGIALITDNVSLIIAPNNWHSTYSGKYDEPWNGNSNSVWGGHDKLITGIKTTLNESNAITDFEGSANTDAIIAQGRGMGGANVYYDGVPAAEYCRAYSHGCKGVGEWYLPAAGEVNEMVLNRDKIEVALAAISGELFTEPGEEFTSTQGDKDYVWVYKWFEDKFDYKLKIQPYGVRPVCAL